MAAGAAMWSLDSIFRAHLVGQYSAFFIVFVTQIICACVVLPICWIHRERLLKLDRKDWAAFLLLAVASNILAMIAFTMAFSRASNFSTPVLIQKLQPLVSVVSAVIFLKETFPRNYFFFFVVALVGSLFVGFGEGSSLKFSSEDIAVAALSLTAAALWGVGTTAGRYLSLRYPYFLVTALRYVLSAIVMTLALPIWWNEPLVEREALLRDLPLFLAMALIPGLLALAIFYRGLQSTKASIACWLELAYPLSAVIVNWIFLGSRLSMLQISGGALLLGAVTALNYRAAQAPMPPRPSLPPPE